MTGVLSLSSLQFSRSIKINDRRHKVYRLALKRFSQDEIASMVDVSRRTIVNDLNAIREHTTQYMQEHPDMIRESFEMIKEITDSYDQIIREGWVQYHNAANPHVKVSFLNTVRNTERQKAELLKLVGVEGATEVQVNILNVQLREQIQTMNNFLVEFHPELLEEYEQYLRERQQ